MDMQEFIENNRTEIANAIWRVVPNCRIDDDELEMWINNDEGLYAWAASEGVFDEEDDDEDTMWECDYCNDNFSQKEDGDPIYIISLQWDVCKKCAEELEQEVE